MKKVLCILLCLAMVFAMAACGKKEEPQQGGEEKKETITFAISHPDPSVEEDLFQYMCLRWDHWLDEYSGGTMRIEAFGDASLGNEKDSFNMVKDGTLDMGLLGSVSCSGQYSMLEIFDMPCLYNDDQDFYDLMHDDAVLKPLYDGLEKDCNMHIFGLVTGGFRKLIGGKVDVPTTMDDFKQMKVRVSDNAVLNAMWTALGATPANVPYAECFTAHQTHVIDAAEWPMGVINSNGYYEVCDWVQNTDLYRLTLIPIINLDKWNALSAEQQKWMTDSYLVARDEQMNMIIKQNAEFVGKWAKSGCTYYESAPKDEMKAATEVVWEQFRDEIGGEFIDAVRAKVDELHKAHTK